MGTLSSPTKVKNIYQRLAFWTDSTGQVSLDAGKDLADVPLFRPQVDISRFGITGNLASTDQDNFEAALLFAEGTTLVVDRPVAITANTTIGATNTLHFTRSGSLTVAAGIVLTFTRGCSFNDCHHAIFSFADKVRVTGVINHPYWRVEWFGGAADDTAADNMEYINEFFDHRRDTGVGAYPTVFEFVAGNTYYTTTPLQYVSTGSYMADLVIQSTTASRWGGAVLKSYISSTEGGKVVDASYTTAGGLVTRCVFRNIRFWGHGTAGQYQTDYVVDASMLDLVRFDKCGFFYCNYGLKIEAGEGEPGAGAGTCTDCYFVNNTDYNTMMMRVLMNMRFINPIIENAHCEIGGNGFEPISFVNPHLETITIVGVSDMIVIEKGGWASTFSITLMPETHDCYIWGGLGTRSIVDLGHNNTIRGGNRYLEHSECSPSMTRPMSFAVARSMGDHILQKDETYLLSFGVNRDGVADFDFVVNNYANSVTPVEFKDYGNISHSTGSTIMPIRWTQIWDVVKPDRNLFLGSSTKFNLRATKPLSKSADMSSAYRSGNTIAGWYQTSPTNWTLSDDGGKIAVTSTTAAWSLYQIIATKQGRKYVLVVKFTALNDKGVPQVAINGNVSSPTSGSTSVLAPINTTGDEYMAVVPFAANKSGYTQVSFGWPSLPAPDIDARIEFFAVAEISDEQRFTSDGLPAVGVFNHGDEIYDKDIVGNSAYKYVCNTTVAGTFGASENGCFLNLGAFDGGADYELGDCVSYSSAVYVSITDHSASATTPNSDTTNWRVLQVQSTGANIADGNTKFTTIF